MESRIIARRIAYHVLVALLPLPCIFAQAVSGPASPRDYHFTISSRQSWTDTGIDLQAGDQLEIKATAALGGGPLNSESPKPCQPEGQSETAVASQTLPVPSAPPGALIAKLKSRAGAVLIGTGKDLRSTESGHLFFGINAAGPPACTGDLAVSVHLLPQANSQPSAQPGSAPSGTAEPAGADSSTAPNVKQKLAAAAQTWVSGQFGTGTSATAAVGSSAIPATGGKAPADLTISDAPLDAALRKNIDGLPRRVNDEYKNLGDMVNFVLVGSVQQVQSALEAASWHLADTDVKESALKAVLETYKKQDYLQMPMSQLMLFGRVQDFGYEQAEAYSVVASRHHFRLWKAPFTWDDQTVWVGAGTHDVGFEKDQRNGKLTHKIDPAVDGERTNIGASLQKADKVKSLGYYLPPDPIQEAKNATGGGYHSDGRILVIFLK